MRLVITAVAVAALAGCGADTAGTAATAAAVKKREIEQGKTTMDKMQKDIGSAYETSQQSRERADDTAK